MTIPAAVHVLAAWQPDDRVIGPFADIVAAAEAVNDYERAEARALRIYSAALSAAREDPTDAEKRAKHRRAMERFQRCADEANAARRVYAALGVGR